MSAAEFVLPLFHAENTMMTVLVWQVGSVVLFTLLDGFAARMGLGAAPLPVHASGTRRINRPILS